MIRHASLCPWLMLVVLAAGCGRSADAELAPLGEAERESLRADLMLSAEPGEPLSVLKAREAAQGGEIVVVGRIGGIDDPWSRGHAAFVMADLSLQAGHQHDHDCSQSGCHFCASNQQVQYLALVRFLDENGELLPADARQVFDLNVGQEVVVLGRAEVFPSGQLVITATGLYPRT